MEECRCGLCHLEHRTDSRNGHATDDLAGSHWEDGEKGVSLRRNEVLGGLWTQIGHFEGPCMPCMSIL